MDGFKSKNWKKKVGGWEWTENFGRWMGGSAKPQIEHMYPFKYQVPPPGYQNKFLIPGWVLNRKFR